MPTAKQGVAAIAPNSETLHHLNSLVATTAALRRAGYVVEKLTNSELELKKRCLTCGVRSELRQSKPPMSEDPANGLCSRQENTPGRPPRSRPEV